MESIETVTDIITNKTCNDTTEHEKEALQLSSLLEKDSVYNTEDKSENSLDKDQKDKTLSGYQFHKVMIALFLIAFLYLCTIFL